MTLVSKSAFALAASAITLLGLPALRAQTLVFNVDLNTAGLSADAANAPFDLDFLLSHGNGSLATDTVTLSDFSFAGGSALGSPVTTGAAAGNLDGTVDLTASDANPDAEFYQEIGAGVTNIDFVATIKEPGPDLGTPSEFAVSLLDSSLGFPAQLYTTAPDTASLVTLDLNSANTIADVGTYASLSSADGNTPVGGVVASVSPVPDSGPAALELGAALLLLLAAAGSKGRIQNRLA